MDRFTALSVFRAIAEHGGFAAAARALDLSPSAVSKNVRELEASLGVPLVIRNSRSVSLTEAGRRYAARADEILRALASASDEAAALADGPRGTVRVTAPMSIGLLELAPLVPRFLAEHPELKLDVEFDDRHVDLVARGFDVAIRGHGPLPDSLLKARRLGELERVVCASPDYLSRAGRPETPADLERHACLLYTLSTPANRWTLGREGRTSAVHVDGPYRANNSLALRRAALGGLGITLMPRRYVERDLARGDLVAVLDDWRPASQSIHALHAFDGPMPARVRAFVDAVAARLGGTRTSGDGSDATDELRFQDD